MQTHTRAHGTIVTHARTILTLCAIGKYHKNILGRVSTFLEMRIRSEMIMRMRAYVLSLVRLNGLNRKGISEPINPVSFNVYRLTQMHTHTPE